MPTGAGSVYLSHDHPASGYAIVAVAAVVARKRRIVSHAVLALTGIGETAYLANSAQALIGSSADPADLGRAADQVAAHPGRGCDSCVARGPASAER